MMFSRFRSFAWPGALIMPLVALLMASVAGAQTHATNPADSLAQVEIQSLIAAAATRGIPSEPLLTKVREGLAKQAPPARIRDAVKLLATRLEASQSALATARSVEEISAGAGALQAGVSAATLRDLRRAWPVRSLTVPLGVLTEMVARGVSTSRATSALRALMDRGVTNPQLVALSSDVQADVVAGLSPTTAFDVRAKGIMSQLGTPSTTTDITTGIGAAAHPTPRHPRPPP